MFSKFNKTDFVDATLADENSVRQLVAGTQASWSKLRGSTALAGLVAQGYVTIRSILANVDPGTRSKILEEHGIPSATNGTFKFTPWIGVLFGERSLDASETFKDAGGTERVRWYRDRSMERYFHVMEMLEEEHFDTDDVKFLTRLILDRSGAAAMVRNRLKAKRVNNAEAREKAEEGKRDVFFRNIKSVLVDVPLDRPEDHGEYATLLVKFVDGSQTQVEVLGYANPNAMSVLNRMAADKYELYKQAERIAEEKSGVPKVSKKRPSSSSPNHSKAEADAIVGRLRKKVGQTHPATKAA